MPPTLLSASAGATRPTLGDSTPHLQAQPHLSESPGRAKTSVGSTALQPSCPPQGGGALCGMSNSGNSRSHQGHSPALWPQKDRSPEPPDCCAFGRYRCPGALRGRRAARGRQRHETDQGSARTRGSCGRLAKLSPGRGETPAERGFQSLWST